MVIHPPQRNLSATVRPFAAASSDRLLMPSRLQRPGAMDVGPLEIRHADPRQLGDRQAQLGAFARNTSRLAPVGLTSCIPQGVSFFNPTQRTISLFQKLLNIAELPLERDRLTWASTNLLIDPRGELRDFQHTHTQPKRPSVLDDDIFDNEPSIAAKAGYGQVEFESPWDGGLDVRILDVKKFRTSSGRLGRKQFDFEKKRREEALYFHCLCCGDVVSPFPSRLCAPELTRRAPSVHE